MRFRPPRTNRDEPLPIVAPGESEQTGSDAKSESSADYLARVRQRRDVRESEKQFERFKTINRDMRDNNAADYPQFVEMTKESIDGGLDPHLAAALARCAIEHKRPKPKPSEASAPERKSVAEYRRWLTDDELALLKPHLPQHTRRNAVSAREVVNWLIWLDNTGNPMVAAKNWRRIDQTNRRWAIAGVWAELFSALRDETSTLHTGLESDRLAELLKVAKAGADRGKRKGEKLREQEATASAHDKQRRAARKAS